MIVFYRLLNTRRILSCFVVLSTYITNINIVPLFIVVSWLVSKNNHRDHNKKVFTIDVVNYNTIRDLKKEL